MAPSNPYRAGALVALALLVCACSEDRAQPDAGVCPTWKDQVGALLAAQCSGCHDFADYGTAIAARDQLASALTNPAPGSVHDGLAGTAPTLAAWVSCDVPYASTPIHPGGILDPSSDDFHGKELLRRDWSFDTCRTCHGEALDGGTSGVSCKTCHEDGPTACDTCHAASPTTGAHATHTARWTCDECHDVPAAWDAPGHILRDGHADPSPAELTFGALASQDTTPSYDPATKTCGVYCHGSARPRWTGGAGEAACGTCHGDPPTTHAWSSCATCHPDGPGSPRHVDGVLAIGKDDATSTCDGCHGQGATGAPPPDLSGNLFPDALGVGAHQSHLLGPHALASAVRCTDCHLVPATVTATGHLDTTAPAEVVATAGWDRASATCTNRCHGDFAPRWTEVGGSQIYCGSCHAVPPASAPHTPDLQLSDCATCHPRTVDAYGNILRSGPPGDETSEHMDGNVDVGP